MLDKLKALFSNVFPEQECAVPIKEPNILESPNWYWVLLQDKRFDNHYRVRVMRPYLYTGPQFTEKNRKVRNQKPLYGWVDDGGNVSDDATRPINLDDEQVIGIGDRT